MILSNKRFSLSDRKYIEQPLKPAPPQIVTSRQLTSTSMQETSETKVSVFGFIL